MASQKEESKPKEGENKPKVHVEVRDDGTIYVEGELRAPSMSEGAEGHAEGTCHPCAWYWKDPICKHGEKCSFCHMCGPDELGKKSKLRRAQIKRRRADK